MKDVPESLPGADLVRQGLTDLGEGKKSVAALLVSLAASRLRRAGLDVPHPIAEADHLLYLTLASTHGDDAHAQYNALIRRLVSFERALECAK